MHAHRRGRARERRSPSASPPSPTPPGSSEVVAPGARTRGSPAWGPRRHACSPGGVDAVVLPVLVAEEHGGSAPGTRALRRWQRPPVQPWKRPDGRRLTPPVGACGTSAYYEGHRGRRRGNLAVPTPTGATGLTFWLRGNDSRSTGRPPGACELGDWSPRTTRFLAGWRELARGFLDEGFDCRYLVGAPLASSFRRSPPSAPTGSCGTGGLAHPRLFNPGGASRRRCGCSTRPTPGVLDDDATRPPSATSNTPSSLTSHAAAPPGAPHPDATWAQSPRRGLEAAGGCATTPSVGR